MVFHKKYFFHALYKNVFFRISLLYNIIRNYTKISKLLEITLLLTSYKNAKKDVYKKSFKHFKTIKKKYLSYIIYIYNVWWIWIF